MKYLIFTFCISLTLLANAQTPTKKISSDSIRYYQKELNKLWTNTYDSLKNSGHYKELQYKISSGKRQKNVTVELLANIGFYLNDFANLNRRLKSIGQKQINGATPSVGASLAIGRPIMIYGIELSAYTLENSTSSFKGGHGRFFLATNLFKKGRFALNPQIGISGSFLNMFIEKSATQTNFNDLFAGQANAINLIHSQSYLDFALGLKIKSFTKDPFYWQFFRVGYRYGLKAVAWEIRSGSLIDAPIDRNNQFYFQLCLGFDR